MKVDYLNIKKIIDLLTKYSDQNRIEKIFSKINQELS